MDAPGQIRNYVRRDLGHVCLYLCRRRTITGHPCWSYTNNNLGFTSWWSSVSLSLSLDSWNETFATSFHLLFRPISTQQSKWYSPILGDCPSLIPHSILLASGAWRDFSLKVIHKGCSKPDCHLVMVNFPFKATLDNVASVLLCYSCSTSVRCEDTK